MLNRTLPVIREKAEQLLAMRQQERDERRRERLHMLWLLASGAENNRTALARRLGRTRESVSAWLKDYAQGGLAGLLRAPQPCGRPNQGGISLPAEVREAIGAQLSAVQGQRGYQTLWRWAQAEHALALSYSHFHRWARYHLGAKLKVARKSHAKKKTRNSPPSTTAA